MKPEDSGPTQAYEGSVYDSSLESSTPVELTVSRGKWSPLHLNKWVLRFVAATAALVVLTGSGALIVRGLEGEKRQAQNNSATNYQVSNVSVEGVKASNLQVGQADHIAVNGQLRVSNTVVLSPMSAPATPVTGQ